MFIYLQEIKVTAYKFENLNYDQIILIFFKTILTAQLASILNFLVHHKSCDRVREFLYLIFLCQE